MGALRPSITCFHHEPSVSYNIFTVLCKVHFTSCVYDMVLTEVIDIFFTLFYFIRSSIQR